MKFLKLMYCNGLMECMRTKYDYKLGDIIYVNDCHDLFKCVKITREFNDIYYHFKQGKVTYDFEWEVI